jgi:hypothetical protein
MHYILIVMMFGVNVGNTSYQEFNTKLACEHAEKDVLKQYTNASGKNSVTDVSAFCEEKELDKK